MTRIGDDLPVVLRTIERSHDASRAEDGAKERRCWRPSAVRCLVTSVLTNTRDTILVNIAELRCDLLNNKRGTVVEQVNRLCDAAVRWVHLPKVGRDSYGKALLEAVFDAAEDLDDDSVGTTRQRAIVELLLWDVVVELGIDRYDERSEHYIEGRRTYLLQNTLSADAGRLESYSIRGPIYSGVVRLHGWPSWGIS